MKGGRVVIAAVLGAITMCAGVARGQCEAGWDVGVTEGLPDFDNTVTTTMNWDPDGPGPAPEMVVFGGTFLNAGNLGNVNHIVGWDGARWVRFGEGLPREVIALGSYRGELVASYRGTVGQVSARGVSRWDGSQWIDMGEGLIEGVPAKLLEFGGALLATPGAWAHFEFQDGATYGHMAQWAGEGWREFPDPPNTGPPGTVLDMTVWNGRLVVAGYLAAWSGAQYKEVGALEWNAPWWVPLGSNAPKSATTLGQYGDDLFIGSANRSPNNVTGSVQKWDGQAWSIVGGGLGDDEDVTSFELWKGKVLAAGYAWDGTQWTQLPPVGYGADRWCAMGEELVVLGNYTRDPVTFRHAARLDGARWTALGGGPATWSRGGTFVWVNTVHVHDGRVFVGGLFQGVGREPVSAIAEWTATGWRPVGEKFIAECDITDLFSFNGELIAIGGLIPESTMQSLGSIARFDGAHWRSLGTQPAYVRNAAVYRGGLYAYAVVDDTWGLARLDGSSWVKVWEGEAEISDLVSAGEDLIAYGQFTSIGGVLAKRIARWDGTEWHAIGAGLESQVRVAIVHDGTLFAAGDGVLGSKKNVARWDGTAWQDAGDGIQDEVTALTEWNGGLFAGARTGVCRWNGGSWEKLAEVLPDPLMRSSWIWSLTGFGDTLFVGGSFRTPGDKLSPHFARWREPVAPSIGTGPEDAIACRGGTARFAVSAAGSEPLTYRWRRGGVALVDGPTDGGSVISGATRAALTVSGASAMDEGEYDCLVSNACAEVSSEGAVLAVCFSDFDCNGFVNGADFDAFVWEFYQGSAAADVDHNGFVNGEDFDSFTAAFVAGC